jgi:hypothetical protein
VGHNPHHAGVPAGIEECANRKLVCAVGPDARGMFQKDGRRRVEGVLQALSGRTDAAGRLATDGTRV